MIEVNSMLLTVFGDFLFCLFFLETVSAELRPGLYKKLHDKKFSNVTTSISTSSAIACCVMCERTGTCSVVSYHRQSRTCDLGNFRPGDDELIQPMTGWSLYINTAHEQQHQVSPNVSVPNPEEGLCPLGWDQVGTSCYYIDTSLQTWTSAQATCSVNGGHLLNVNTETENSDVINLYTTKHPGIDKQVWIGGQDVDSNEIFYWTDGSLVSDGFEFWFTDQPDNWGMGEDCMLLRSYQGFTWNDGGCASEFWSICEKEL